MCHKFMAHPLFFISSKFFSSDCTDESEAFLLVGLLTDFCGILAAGQWLAPYICSCCFLSRRFRRWRRFFFVEVFFVPQISQIYTDFFMKSLVNLFVSLRGYLQRPDRSHPWKSLSNRLSRKSPNKFRVIRWIKSASSAKSAWLKKLRWKICVYLWNLWDFF